VALSAVVTARAAPSIKRAVDVRRVMSLGRRLSGQLVTVYVLGVEGESRAAFACSRRVGGAVVRNRARRLMREAWRAMRPQVGPGRWIMFVARPQIVGAGLGDVLADVERSLHRAGVLG
jgi:ribonuclease P protein component